MSSRRDNDDAMAQALLDSMSGPNLKGLTNPCAEIDIPDLSPCYICASRPRRSGMLTCAICGFGRNDVASVPVTMHAWDIFANAPMCDVESQGFVTGDPTRVTCEPCKDMM